MRTLDTDQALESELAEHNIALAKLTSCCFGMATVFDAYSIPGMKQEKSADWAFNQIAK